MLGPKKYTKSNATGSYGLRLDGAVYRFLSSGLCGWLLPVVCKEGCLFNVWFAEILLVTKVSVNTTIKQLLCL
jgi:hypothetical protein